MNFKKIFVYPKYPENLSKLYELSQNLWCTWNYDSIDMFYRIDPELFRKVNHNPVQFLLMLSKDKIDDLAQDDGFLYELNRVWDKFKSYMAFSGTTRDSQNREISLSKEDLIAYWSMEFGLHESIPIYSGGLGILAGDHLKAASDLGINLVGVGLLYKYGYFTQRLNVNGQQEELYDQIQKHMLPLKRVAICDDGGDCLELQILNDLIKLRVWQLDVGRTKLILLDTDIEANPPRIRQIGDELYVTDRRKRLYQELILGIAGVKALQQMKIAPTIYHINEGHAVFLVLARLQHLMTQEKMSFVQARAFIRATTVFTTHTPVVAGNEHFETRMVRLYIEPMLDKMGINFDEFAELAFMDRSKDQFWLPALAIRFASSINAVSQLHADVSRRMWSGLFPDRPAAEIPVDNVTNGVHRSWISDHFTKLMNRYLGPEYIHCCGDSEFWDKIKNIPDEDIWQAHRKNKQNLVYFIRKKLSQELTGRGYSQTKIMNLTRLLNPEYMIVVFARRFAPYKRANLILKEKERLKELLMNPRKPVQLIFSGKAHPADENGKKMIKDIVDFARSNGLEDRVIFLENYDIDVARHLVWGADVWLNTPIRENEASGTSGMKAGMNGVLNFSVRDGWWAEGYNGRNGWAITAGEYYRHSEVQEEAEAHQIYNLLNEEITELYYDRNEFGIPVEWVKMMKESISSICRTFNMNRAVTEYTEKFYIRTSQERNRVSADDYKLLKEAEQIGQQVRGVWDRVKITEFNTNIDQVEHPVELDKIEAKCTVFFGDAQPDLFAVEMFYMLEDGRRIHNIPMALKSFENGNASYECFFDIESFGLQEINVRVVPANQIIRGMNPEWLKWFEPSR